jgi:hypothetical protein
MMQREFSKSVLEAVVLATVHRIAPAPSTLRAFVALERATGDCTKPATRLLQTIERERARIDREQLAAALETLPKRRKPVIVAESESDNMMPAGDITQTRPRRTARAGRTIHEGTSAQESTISPA